jgi:hypothetical protein
MPPGFTAYTAGVPNVPVIFAMLFTTITPVTLL